MSQLGSLVPFVATDCTSASYTGVTVRLAFLGSRCRVDGRESAATDIVILDDGDKVKFPRGEVILCGIAWR